MKRMEVVLVASEIPSDPDELHQKRLDVWGSKTIQRRKKSGAQLVRGAQTILQL